MAAARALLCAVVLAAAVTTAALSATAWAVHSLRGAPPAAPLTSAVLGDTSAAAPRLTRGAFSLGGLTTPTLAASVPSPREAGHSQNLLPTLPLSAACVACLVAALGRRALVVRRGKGRSGKAVACPGLRVRKPMNNALRNCTVPTLEEITTNKRYNPLCQMYRRSYGKRNGTIWSDAKRARINGLKFKMFASAHAKLYRIVDFFRSKRDVYGEIEEIEYDPYRSTRVCRVRYDDGEYRFILYAIGMFKGQQIIAQDDAPILVGNALKLGNVPQGTQIHNLEMFPNKGGALCRSAGNAGIVLSRDDKFVTVKLPSTEVRMFSVDCYCTVGRVGRPEHQLRLLGKAGKRKHFGFRPRVRGKSKNACDHPHGGGEGHSPIGYKYPCTPKGRCIWARTRPLKMRSDKYIVIPRPRGPSSRHPRRNQ